MHATYATRQTSDINGRISDHIRTGEVFTKLKLDPWKPETDRVMVCGSMALNKDIMNLCEEAGLTEGANSKPAEFVIEKAFVE